MAIQREGGVLSDAGRDVRPAIPLSVSNVPAGIVMDNLGVLDTGCTHRAVVEIADCRVLDDPTAELVTYSLGSCIGVTVWDPVVRVGGMLHFMLPDSRNAPQRIGRNDAMFADTGLPRLFHGAYKLGAVKQRLVVKVAGGSAFFKTTEEMNIGRQNYAMLQHVFARNGIRVDGEHVGDMISRTMRLNVGTGRVTVQNRKMGRIDI